MLKTKDIEFIDEYEFADYLADLLYNDDRCATFIAKFDRTKALFKALMECCDVDFEGIKLESKEMSGCSDEFATILWSDEDCIQIGIEPCKHEGKYLNIDDDIIFVDDECNSKIIKHCDASEIQYVHISDEEDFECEDCDCDKCIAKCGLANDGTTGKEKYFANSNATTKDEFDDACEEAKAMLRKYCDYMDMVNDILALL